MQGDTALMVAAKSGNPGIIEQLLSHKDVDADVKNSDGLNVLDLAKKCSVKEDMIAMVEPRDGIH